MIDKNKWQLLLTYADNGMVLDNPNYVVFQEDALGGNFLEVIETNVKEDKSLADAKLVKRMVYRLIEYFGLNRATGKHEKYNLELKIVEKSTGKEIE